MLPAFHFSYDDVKCRVFLYSPSFDSSKIMKLFETDPLAKSKTGIVNHRQNPGPLPFSLSGIMYPFDNFRVVPCGFLQKFKLGKLKSSLNSEIFKSLF